MPYRFATESGVSAVPPGHADALAPPAVSAACGSRGGERLLWCAEDCHWTHSAALDAVFAVLTVIIVPIVALRLLRRGAAARPSIPRALARIGRFHRF